MKHLLPFNETLKSHTIEVVCRRISEYFKKLGFNERVGFCTEAPSPNFQLYHDRIGIKSALDGYRNPTKERLKLIKKHCKVKDPMKKSQEFADSYQKELDNFQYGDISVFADKNSPEILKNLLNLIESLGYFVAAGNKSKGDTFEDREVKDKSKIFDELKNESTISLFIEPYYDSESEHKEEYLYHTTSKKFRDKILSKGLIPKSKNTRSFYPDRIYLSPNEKWNKSIKDQLISDKNEETVTFKIKKFPGLKLYKDLRFNGGFYTYTNIPPKYIEVVDEIVKEGMKHLQAFTEKMGINQNTESQCDVIYKEINLPENKNKLEFNFTYLCSRGGVEFKLIIDDKLDKKESGKQGEFSHNPILNTGFTISLLNRENKDVLLHELKHLDYVIQNKKANTGKLIKDIQKFDKKRSDGIYQAIFLFYVFDTDEFQAKYHGYYSYVDSYIKKNLTDELKNSEGITKLVNAALRENIDKSFTYYLNKNDFKFSSYGISQEDLNKILIRYVRDKDISSISTDTGNIFKDIINVYKWGLKDAWNDIKTKIGILTGSEQKKINELIKKLEKDINWKRRKYKRKFRRILTLMLDKYLPNKTR